MTRIPIKEEDIKFSEDDYYNCIVGISYPKEKKEQLKSQILQDQEKAKKWDMFEELGETIKFKPRLTESELGQFISYTYEIVNRLKERIKECKKELVTYNRQLLLELQKILEGKK